MNKNKENYKIEFQNKNNLFKICNKKNNEQTEIIQLNKINEKYKSGYK